MYSSKELILFSYSPTVYINPSIKALFTQLIDKGWQIKLLAPIQHFNLCDSKLNISFKKIIELTYTEPLKVSSWFNRCIELMRTEGNAIKIMLAPVKALWREIIVYKKTRQARNEQNKFIGRKGFKVFLSMGSIAAQETLIAYKKYNKKSKTHGIISFEIECWDEYEKLSPDILELKKNSDHFLKVLDFVVIQDSMREKMFREQNTVNDKAKVFHIPVASLGKHTREPRKLDLTRKIRLLHSGSAYKWSGMEWITNGIRSSIKSDYSLTIHSFKNINENNYIKELKILSSEKRNIFFLSKVMSDSEHENFVLDYDIGIAIYQNDESNNGTLGRNMENIGLSSGKFSLFMKMGIPVIMKSHPFMLNLVSSEPIGYLMNSTGEWDDAIDYITENYDVLSKNCISFYERRLNPYNTMEPFFSFLAGED